MGDIKNKRRVAEIAILTVVVVAVLVTSISVFGSVPPGDSVNLNGTPCGNMTRSNQTVGVHCIEFPVNRSQLPTMDYTLS
ncbi:hypothetical protein HYW21_02790 [Candidatus Woesearchaeota archaeon]|nr:hypothetical protein [Candidatus Woesearchaeota archaeon]